ncbi:MAG: hypothetical protein JST43_00340 [Bacteroidetes bacterium]|nr:hypothetical protein [Bacteroidota bacterium]MBS1540803.1 hypothetical protein [Bacteroidota bacterium]
METKDHYQPRQSGRAFAGFILIVIGAVLLSRQMGLDVPSWLLTWQMLLIGLGIFFGARKMFRPGGWMVMVLVGTAFMIDEFADIDLHHYIWPAVIILVGFWMIVKPRKHRREWQFENTSDVADNKIDINSVFSGSKKKVMSKDFKGGMINTVFGGNDIDLTQADINTSALLELNVVFGGTKLLVPANWKIQSDVDCIFAAVEDKRRDTTQVSDKTLILKGSVVFGGIEIKSY